MSATDTRRISEPALRRYPHYHNYLTSLAAEGQQYVSCSQIGAELSVDPTQVRKDLVATGMIGKPNVGHSVRDLLRAIEDMLGWNNTKDAFLAGAGHLGTSLLCYEGFKQYGLNIVAAFDIAQSKIGTEIYGKQVLSLARLPGLAQRMRVHIGIITVPSAAAQMVADKMVEGGIRAIWNFAPGVLHVPESVIVQHESLESSLAALAFKLARRLVAEAERRSTEYDREPDTFISGEIRKGLSDPRPV